MRRRVLLLISVLGAYCSAAMGWQLHSLSLEGRVRESSVVILGVPVAVLEKTPSLFGGGGEEWRVRVRVGDVLKGHVPGHVVVRFSDVAVQTPPGFVLDSPRIWLLKESPQVGEFYAPAHYISILDSSNATAALDAVSRDKKSGKQ